MTQSRLTEVKWGEEQEQAVLSRWMRSSPRCHGADRVVKSRPGQWFDYLVLDTSGFVVAYVEIKVRRVRLSDFGDAIAPMSKHEYAVKLWRRHRHPVLMVVAYASGELVEVDLAQPPAETKELVRKDRDRGSVHGLWKNAQLTIVAEVDFESASA